MIKRSFEPEAIAGVFSATGMQLLPEGIRVVALAALCGLPIVMFVK